MKARNVFKFLVAAMATVIVITQPGYAKWRNNPVSMGGHGNPQYVGKAYKRIAVAAINVPPDFRAQLEQVTAINLSRAITDESDWNKTRVIDFASLFADPAFQPDGKYTIEYLMGELNKQGVDAILFINITNEGGENIDDIGSLEKALDVAANYKHKVGPVVRYKFSKVLVYDLKDKVGIWSGGGVVKAKPQTTKWFNVTARTMSKKLVKLLEKENVLVVTGEQKQE